jgi:hypothetical protein
MTLLLIVGFLLSGPVLSGVSSAEGATRVDASRAPAVCEDFAKRQVGLADRLLQQSNYTRAIKVLNSTIKNCERDFVRDKLYEALGEWYVQVRGSSTAELRQYVNVLSNQAYLTSGQRSRLESRIRSNVRSRIAREASAENYREAYQLCRGYPGYVDDNFRARYFCGRAAEEVGAEATAMEAYAWMLENWTAEQDLTTWSETASTLESLYFLNGRFQEAYGLAREEAIRNTTPKAILSSLISIRGKFLSPLLRVGAAFYDAETSEAAFSHIDREMQRVSFPKYVKAFYVLGSGGAVKRGMYGTEANAPSDSLLELASGTVSLLQEPGESNRSWLVSPLDAGFLVLEFGVGTTAEENVRLESVHENVENRQQWKKLYQLEFTKTSPASGSAIGTILGASLIADADFGTYDEIFDDSPVLTYYCIQNDGEKIAASYNFNRSKLGYGEDEWNRTSNTPALYHHDIQYGGRSVREVVWPNFVDEKWTGVVRVGLVRS